jgi:hypothetical protein
MKLRCQTYQFLPAAILVYSLSPVLAEAQFTQQAKLVAKDAIGSAQQGYSVAISADGSTTIVGGIGDDLTGAAWIYTRADGVWREQAKLVGTDAIGDSGQGSAVALSGDGSTAIVGGYNDDDGAGAAWIFTRSYGLWSQQAKLVGTGALTSAEQGLAVAISEDGSTAIVGGPFDGAGTSGNGSPGAVWVFTRSRGGVWSQQAKLVGTGAIGNAFQGVSVSLSADGSSALIGGDADDSPNGFVPGVGAAWVFTRWGTVWTQRAKLIGSGAVGLAAQGASVSLSADGNTAAIGGENDNPSFPLAVGATWVFHRAGRSWYQQGPKIVGTGAIGLAKQGFGVSLSKDGDTLAVGGRVDDGEIGATWVFARSRGSWRQLEKLVATDAIGRANEGFSVSFSGDGGGRLLVGGPGDNAGTGAAWVFVRPVFAETLGKANCYGQSFAALAEQYGGLINAAAALGFDSVSALQNAVGEFCGD